MNQPRKWSLATFIKRANTLKQTFGDAYAALQRDSKLLQKRRWLDHKQIRSVLQHLRNLQEAINSWSTLLSDHEHLPFLVRSYRYPSLIASSQLQQDIDQLISCLIDYCTEWMVNPLNTRDIKQRVRVLITQCKTFSCERQTLLDLISFSS